jgi:hypothetical protein
MAIDIDGLAVLRAIAENPLAFPDVTAEINEVARILVLKQVKSKTTLERLRLIRHALGGEALALILDGLDNTPSATLVRKLDKDNPGLKTASPEWCRKRLADLASGAAEPVVKPTPVTPKKEPIAKKPTRSPEQKALAIALKAKTTNLASARELWREVGESSFMFILGDLTPLQKTALAKKLDKDNPELKTASPEWCRERIADLASGGAEPVFKSILESKAMAAKRTRTNKKA